MDIPESVLAYFKDPQVRAGVDAMTLRSDKVPADLRWAEVGAYYRAFSAAQRLVVDHAMLLKEVWDAVWAPAIPTGWMSVDPDEQTADAGRSLHPKVVWGDGAYYRCYNIPLRTVHTAVSVSESGFYVGFGVFKHRTGSNALPQPIAGFDLGEDECHWQERPLPLSADWTIDVARLVAHRDEALQAINGASSSGSKQPD